MSKSRWIGGWRRRRRGWWTGWLWRSRAQHVGRRCSGEQDHRKYSKPGRDEQQTPSCWRCGLHGFCWLSNIPIGKQGLGCCHKRVEGTIRLFHHRRSQIRWYFSFYTLLLSFSESGARAMTGDGTRVLLRPTLSQFVQPYQSTTRHHTNKAHAIVCCYGHRSLARLL